MPSARKWLALPTVAIFTIALPAWSIATPPNSPAPRNPRRTPRLRLRDAERRGVVSACSANVVIPRAFCAGNLLASFICSEQLREATLRLTGDHPHPFLAVTQIRDALGSRRRSLACCHQ